MGTGRKGLSFLKEKKNKRGELSDHLSFPLQSSLWTVT